MQFVAVRREKNSYIRVCGERKKKKLNPTAKGYTKPLMAALGLEVGSKVF